MIKEFHGTHQLVEPMNYIETGFAMCHIKVDGDITVKRRVLSNLARDFYYIKAEVHNRGQKTQIKFLGAYKTFSEADLFELSRIKS